MKTAVLLLNFGEPEHPALGEVVPFLERIFMMNSDLEGGAGSEARARAHKLAQMRAPGLIEEYEMIGGSPLQRQAREQAEALEAELRRRGRDVTVIPGMQFTQPFIADAVKQARAAGVDRLVALPVYPLCGPSTTVAALERLQADLKLQLWNVPVREISGWHNHPDYLQFRADTLRDLMKRDGLTFDDPATRLVFSAHGTPMKYIEEGSRYDVYVRDFCAAIARLAGAPCYVIGYQNHTNRPIEWTQPDIDAVIAEIDADRVIVDPVSFMHEQSETLAELDHELKEQAAARGVGFHRVPIRHAAPAFISFLADLTEASFGEGVNGQPWRDCRCKPGACCLNAAIPTEPVSVGMQ